MLVFRAGQPLLVLEGDDRIDLDDVLPGFDLTVDAMFDGLAPDWLDEDDEGASPTESDSPSS